ncbi:RhuM family protein [Sulfurimonas sp. HSL3-7]|uniref:virulence RhuM family protein n=1 Tax=Sulfonitrofixus jiaomeiensis TaxID=3131938 RepID=UPI0031F73AEA
MSDIIMYDDGLVVLDATMEDETVWLNQKQMEELFGKSKKTISEHINNIFKEGELEKDAVVRNFRTTASDGKSYNVNSYNLDVIISVGYRVKSKQGVQFRIWATSVLKQHLLKGYTLDQKRLDVLEEKQVLTDKKLEQVFNAMENQSLRPKQGIFYDGQIFDAYVFVSNLIKSAERSIVLIDNYVDESVLTMLDKRAKGCSAVIYTKSVPKKLALDLKKHNAQYPAIEIRKFADAHDRFLIIDDDEVYHIGASLKDLGRKWFAFSKMEKDSLALTERVKEIYS